MSDKDGSEAEKLRAMRATIRTLELEVCTLRLRLKHERENARTKAEAEYLRGCQRVPVG